MTGLLPPHYGQEEELRLSIHSDMATVARAMANPQSGLEVRDRMWLKITIPNAFIGSEVVDWLQRRVEGFSDRREARRYAANLLAAGHIRPTESLPGQHPPPHPYGPPPPPLPSAHWAPTRSHNRSPSSGSERRQRQEVAPPPLQSRQEVGDGPPSPPPSRGHDPSSELPASRQSFRLAIANPSDLLLDVM
ncbi:hypothetical protein CRUP_023537 [Coryphaenoides rupestris]|nr:hypothetical protein CRUP_023537 [Coryphaenoides rupestris]